MNGLRSTDTLLFKFTVDELLEAFDAAVSKSFIDKKLFEACYHDLSLVYKPEGYTAEQWTTLMMKEAAVLFEVLDYDDDGLVNWDGVLSGLLLMCQGDSDDRLHMIFNLYDQNSDGALSFEEVSSYFTSVFKIMYKLRYQEVEDSGSLIQYGKLAHLTAEQFFMDANLDLEHGRVSLELFKVWCRSSDDQSFPGIDSFTPTFASEQAEEKEHDECEESGQRTQQANSGDPSDDDLRAALKLLHLNFEVMVPRLKDHNSAEQSMISESDFVACFVSLSQGTLDAQLATSCAKRLFGLYVREAAENKPKTALFRDLLACLKVFCTVISSSKGIDLLFRLINCSGTGWLTMQELQGFIGAKHRCVFFLVPGATRKLKGICPDEIGVIGAEECFSAASKQFDEQMSLEEFTAWYLEVHVKNFTDEDRQWEKYVDDFCIHKLRTATGLNNFWLADVLSLCSKRADLPDGSLSSMTFVLLLTELCESHAVNHGLTKGRLRVIFRILFRILDSEKSGKVDIPNIAAALSLLCKTKENDKAVAAFSAFDQRKDGHISFGEMKQYLSTVFTFMYELDDGLRTKVGDLCPRKLASTTAKHIFRKAHVNQEGKFPVKDFKDWYMKQMTQLNESKIQCQVLVCDKLQEKVFTIDEVISTTMLSKVPLTEFVKSLLQKATKNGNLSCKGLFKVLKSFRRKVGGHLSERLEWHLKLLAKKVIDIYSNQSPSSNRKRAPCLDVAIGLSVFCKGSDELKCTTAFALLDRNGDGDISKDELTSFLYAIYQIVDHFDQDVKQKYSDADWRKLATKTSDTIFSKADLNQDSQINFHEFFAWYHGDAPSETLENPFAVALFDREVPDSKRSISAEDAHENLKSFSDILSVSGLSHCTFDDVLASFSQLSSPSKAQQVSRLDFFYSFRQLLLKKDEVAAETSRKTIVNAVHTLFSILDVEETGSLEYVYLITALTLFSEGGLYSKAKSLFALYDMNDDGLLERGDIETLVKNLYQIRSSVVALSSTSADDKDTAEVVQHVVGKVFEEQSGKAAKKLEFSTFLASYRKNEYLSGGWNYFVDRQAEETEESGSVQVLAKHIGLTRTIAIDIIQVLSEYSVLLGGKHVIDVERFVAAMKAVHAGALKVSVEEQKGSVSDLDIADMSSQLFRLFRSALIAQVPQNLEILYVNQVAAGLSLFCMDPTEEKLRLAYLMYSSTGEEALSEAELLEYLTSLFVVLQGIRASVPDSSSISVLAQTTVRQILSTTELSDGKVSFEAFFHWCKNEENAALFGK